MARAELLAPPAAVRVHERMLRWWAGEYGVTGRGLRTLLAPVEAIYGSVVRVRNRAYDAGLLRVTRVGVPVVSVGNLALGGTGKTPLAAWLLDELCQRGHRPGLLHGGYAGDEPELHRRWHPDLPVIAQRDRVDGARRAMAQGATALVLDDGFQHRRLARDVDLLLIAAESWSARRSLLPRGPWREHLEAARRATLIVVTRKTAEPARALAVADQVAAVSGRPVVRLALLPAGWKQPGGEDGGPPGEALAVAGVAQPALFAISARAAGAHVAELLPYPDHHAYDRFDAERIVAAARGRPILTTEKDWVKLAGLLDDTQVWLLLQRVEIEAGAAALGSALDGLSR